MITVIPVRHAPALLLAAFSLLPLSLAQAATATTSGPSQAQIEHAILSSIEAAASTAGSDTEKLMHAMFAPRAFEHGPCFASAAEAGAYDCLVGMLMGLRTRYRMLHLQPQGDGWQVDPRNDAPAPAPSREQARELLSARITQRIADTDDAVLRSELRNFQSQLQVLAVEDCTLPSSRVPQIQCTVTTSGGNEHGSDQQTYVFDAQGQWQDADSNEE